MANTCSSQGSQSKMAIASAELEIAQIALEYVSATSMEERTLVESEGIRGTRSRTKERVRGGLVNVRQDIVMHPSPTELNVLLSLILGAAESTDTFALAETLPVFELVHDTGAAVLTVAGAKVNTATFSGSPGQPMELSINWIGKSVTKGAAGSFPSLTFDTDTMFVFTDSVFTFGGTPYDIMSFEITIDNMLEARFTNSTTATCIHATDRRVTCTVTTPWNATTAALHAPSTATAGAAGSVALTNGNQSLSFAFANMKPSPLVVPGVGGRGEITNSYAYNCYKSSTTNELIVTHDSTA